MERKGSEIHFTKAEREEFEGLDERMPALKAYDMAIVFRDVAEKLEEDAVMLANEVNPDDQRTVQSHRSRASQLDLFASNIFELCPDIIASDKIGERPTR